MESATATAPMIHWRFEVEIELPLLGLPELRPEPPEIGEDRFRRCMARGAHFATDEVFAFVTTTSS